MPESRPSQTAQELTIRKHPDQSYPGKLTILRCHRRPLLGPRRRNNAPAQGRKAAPAGGPIGTKSGGSITPKSGGPIPAKSGGSNHSKSCTWGPNGIPNDVWRSRNIRIRRLQNWGVPLAYGAVGLGFVSQLVALWFPKLHWQCGLVFRGGGTKAARG